MRRGHLVAAGGVLVALLLAVPLDLLLRPALFASVLGAGAALLVGARDLAGRFAVAAVVCFVGATTWGGLSETARAAMGDAVGLPGSAPGLAWLALLGVVVVGVLLAGRVLARLGTPRAMVRGPRRARSALVPEPLRVEQLGAGLPAASGSRNDDELGILR